MIRNLLLCRRQIISARNISTTSVNGLREIVTKKEGKVTTVEGRIIPSPRLPYLLKRDPKILNNSCILCQLNLNIKHTDVLILTQFVTSEGELLPRKATGLCLKQYNYIRNLVYMAQEAGLLGNFVTWEGKFDVSKREGYKKYNTYFDESTIVLNYRKGWMRRKL